MAATIIQLPASDVEFTAYFAGALIATFQESSRDKLITGIRELDPQRQVYSDGDVAGMSEDVARQALLQLRFAHYIERLSAEALPRMVKASWLDFATTVIECLPERERGYVWDHLDENEDVMLALKDFLQPTLEKLRYGYEKIQNGGSPPLKSVPA